MMASQPLKSLKSQPKEMDNLKAARCSMYQVMSDELQLFQAQGDVHACVQSS